jgi:hypothetical protein
LTDTELGRFTAAELHIGSLANTGGISIVSAITRHAGYDTLYLASDGPITQTAPLSVAKLAVQSVSADVVLTNASNDVDFLAGTADVNFSYTDATGFVISGVGPRAGIFLGGGADTIVLTAGGAVTQDPNEIIHAGRLLFHGLGSFNLNDPGNDVGTLASGAAGCHHRISTPAD